MRKRDYSINVEAFQKNKVESIIHNSHTKIRHKRFKIFKVKLLR